MAMFLDSTTVPVVQTGLLPLTFRPVQPVDDPRSADELLDEIRRTIEAQEALLKSEDTPELPPEPLLSTDVRHGGGCRHMSTPDSGRVDIDNPLACHADTSIRPPAHLPSYTDTAGVVTADRARAIHLRKQLEAAAEHGAALLAALGLPRLVEPGFIQLDPGMVGDAVEAAVAALDELDGDPDAEPYLAGYYNGAVNPTGEGEPCEEDEDDGTSEPTLGAPERYSHTNPIGSPYYKAANGSYRRIRQWESQVSWAQGSRQDGEGEPDVGYDLPCDEDELDDDGLWRAERDTADFEPSIGWPEDLIARAA